jgi:hypothetical protein
MAAGVAKEQSSTHHSASFFLFLRLPRSISRRHLWHHREEAIAYRAFPFYLECMHICIGCMQSRQLFLLACHSMRPQCGFRC